MSDYTRLDNALREVERSIESFATIIRHGKWSDFCSDPADLRACNSRLQSALNTYYSIFNDFEEGATE